MNSMKNCDFPYSDVSLSKKITRFFMATLWFNGTWLNGGWKTHVCFFLLLESKAKIHWNIHVSYELPIVHGMWITTFHHPKSIEHPILHGLIPTIDSYLPITSHNKSHENGISQVETTSTLKRCQKDSSGTATCGSTSETRRKRKSCHG